MKTYNPPVFTYDDIENERSKEHADDWEFTLIVSGVMYDLEQKGYQVVYDKKDKLLMAVSCKAVHILAEVVRPEELEGTKPKIPNTKIATILNGEVKYYEV